MAASRATVVPIPIKMRQMKVAQVSGPGAGYHRPVALGLFPVESSSRLKYEASGAPAELAAHALEPDEVRGFVSAVAHEPLHRTVTFDIAREGLRDAGSCELSSALDLSGGLLVEGLDLELACRVGGHFSSDLRSSPVRCRSLDRSHSGCGGKYV